MRLNFGKSPRSPLILGSVWGITLIVGLILIGSDLRFKSQEKPPQSLSWKGLDIDIEGALVSEAESSQINLWAYTPVPSLKITSQVSNPVQLQIQVENIPGNGEWKIDPSREYRKKVRGKSVNLSLEIRPKTSLEATWTPSDSPPTEFTYAVIGDLHKGFHAIQPIFQRMEQLIPRPEFVILVGDITTRGYRANLEVYRHYIQTQIDLPVYVCPGNHDRDRDLRLDAYHSLIGPSYYSFDYRGNRFVLADNSLRQFGQEQFQWIQETLESPIPSGSKFFFAHIPAFDPRPGYHDSMIQEGGEPERLTKILVDNRISSAFFGHIHLYHSMNVQGIPFIISGGGGGKPESEKDRYHFIYMRQNPKGWQAEPVYLPEVKTPRSKFLDNMVFAAWSVYLVILNHPVWTGAFLISLLLLLFSSLKYRSPIQFDENRNTQQNLS